MPRPTGLKKVPGAGERSQLVDPVEVVAGVLRDDRGRVLLARRRDGKHLAGTWEFPGGKRESDESASDALARELDEELGISVVEARPWLALTHHYPEMAVRLRLFTVEAWRGEPCGREGQPLQWLAPEDMDHRTMPAADRPVVKALSLHAHYAITPDPAELGGPQALLDWTRGCLQGGARLIQLRAKSLDTAALSRLAGEFSRLTEGSRARWLLNGPPEMAVEAGADGVHLDAPSLRRRTDRPLPGDYLVGASCHDQAELRRAGELALDFVTLSPVRSTASHPGLAGLGWDEFEQLACLSPLPVYALGGVAPGDLAASRQRGGFGVAGIRAFANAA